MPIRKSALYILAIFVFVTSVSAAPVYQGAEEGIFYSETGHWVKGAFYEYFKNSPDPLLLFGFPITEAFPHPLRQGIMVQYFQRARMELDTTSADGEIHLAPLGEWLYDSTRHGEKAKFSTNSGACRLYAVNWKYVCYAFLQFYDTHNGAVYFGEPVSDTEILDNRLVQYFEHARLEWRPEMPAGKRVALTDVGKLHFDRAIGDFNFTDPITGIVDQKLTQIKVHAFADRPLLASGEEQKIFVVVQDQYHNPVTDALIMVSVHYPDGLIENIRPESATNANGFSLVEFKVDNLKPNQVVEVYVTANVVNGPEGKAQTWFRIWW